MKTYVLKGESLQQKHVPLICSGFSYCFGVGVPECGYMFQIHKLFYNPYRDSYISSVYTNAFSTLLLRKHLIQYLRVNPGIIEYTGVSKLDDRIHKYTVEFNDYPFVIRKFHIGKLLGILHSRLNTSPHIPTRRRRKSG